MLLNSGPFLSNFAPYEVNWAFLSSLGPLWGIFWSFFIIFWNFWCQVQSLCIKLGTSCYQAGKFSSNLGFLCIRVLDLFIEFRTFSLSSGTYVTTFGTLFSQVWDSYVAEFGTFFNKLGTLCNQLRHLV